jgi:hypothetical protein
VGKKRIVYVLLTDKLAASGVCFFVTAQLECLFRMMAILNWRGKNPQRQVHGRANKFDANIFHDFGEGHIQSSQCVDPNAV